MNGSVNQTARIISEGLTGQQDRIAEGLGVTLVSSGADFLICDLQQESFEKAREQALAEQIPVCLILPGPLPLAVEKLPGSFVHIVLKATLLAQKAVAIEAAVAALLAEALRTGRLSDTPLLNIWRSLPRLDASSLRYQQAGPENLALQTLIDRVPEAIGNVSEFWSVVAVKIEKNGLAIDRVLETVLQKNSCWFEPYEGHAVAPVTALQILHLLETRWAENDRPVHCFGAQYWNHPSIMAIFTGKGGSVAFHDSEAETIAAAEADGGSIVSWAGRTTAAMEEACAAKKIGLIRIEDGFLRSVGLGAGLATGAMLALDDQGIYYDPSRPSRLETLLQTAQLSDGQKGRGEALIQQYAGIRIKEPADSSYSFVMDKRVVLVIGQPDDETNGPDIDLNLLRAARQRNPDVHIVFIPSTGGEQDLDKDKVAKRDILRLADEVASNVNLADLVEACDEVETFSSSMGFDALLRGKLVTVHGLPFYAGWGLTNDLSACNRRTMRRSLAEFVYLTLAVYARSVDPVTLLPCTPEFLFERLASLPESDERPARKAIWGPLFWLVRKLGLWQRQSDALSSPGT